MYYIQWYGHTTGIGQGIVIKVDKSGVLIVIGNDNSIRLIPPGDVVLQRGF